MRSLDAQGELNTDIDLTGHLDDLGELDRLLGGVLEVLDGEDLKTGLVDLSNIISIAFNTQVKFEHTSL
jgi:hypothetical protein